jgi:hypothetical protein
MNYKHLAIYTVIVIAATYAATKHFAPRIETQVKVEEVEIIKKDVRTIIKEVIKKDGTVEKETVIVDNSQESSKKTSESLKIKKDDWFVAVGIEAKPSRLNEQEYKFEVNRRIISDFFLGASANTEGRIGVQVGFQF